MVGEFITTDRDHFVVATKYTFGAQQNGGLSRSGNSRKNMIRSIEESLKRLRADRIDLYWTHLPDGVTPMEEIVRAFDDLVRSKKILHAGLSNFPAWRVSHAATLSALRGWTPIVGIQVEYSLAERTPERELLPMAEAFGLGVATWSPLGGGFLTGKYRTSDEGRLTKLGILVHTEKSARETAILDTVLAVAGEIDTSPTHVAIAWLLNKAARATNSLIPILGPRTLDQLDGTLGALDVKLLPEQIARLDAASAISLGVPHEQIASSELRLSGSKTGQLVPSLVPVA